MTQEYFTEPYAQDGRLKIVVLDDNAVDEDFPFEKETQLRLARTKRYTPWFAITAVGDLSDLVAIRRHPDIAATVGEYNRLDAPYDVYLLDFRLCDAKEHCSIPSHHLNGIHAPGAGLLGGVFTALNWADHPQAVIPYSGHPDEIGDVWQLCFSFRTDSIHLVEAQTAKSIQHLQELLTDKVAPAYRQALAAAFTSGKAGVALGERQRINRLLDEAGEWVDSESKIRLYTNYGFRDFKLGALFFDVRSKCGVPGDAVREFLNSTPCGDPLSRRARQLAGHFWTLRRTEESHRIYTALRTDAAAPVVDRPYPWIGDAIWRSADDADGILVLRLAVLLLVLYEYGYRTKAKAILCKTEDRADILKSLKQYIDDVKGTAGGLLDESELSFVSDMLVREALASGIGSDADDGYATRRARTEGAFRRLLTTLKELNTASEEAHKAGFANTLDIVELGLPLTPLDIVQLLDPIPEATRSKSGKKKYCRSLDRSGKIGKSLLRLLNGDQIGESGKTIDLVQLLEGDGMASRKVLLESEWLELQRVAAELSVPGDFPLWLSDYEEAGGARR